MAAAKAIYAFFCLISLGLAGGCGPEPEQPRRDPPAIIPPGPGGISFSDVTEVTNKYCKLCHQNARFLQNEEDFLRSDAVAKVRNGSMPPQNSAPYGSWISDPSLKKLILDFAAQR